MKKTPPKTVEKDLYGKHEKHLHQPVKTKLKLPKTK